MKIEKNMIVAVLATFCLTATALLTLPTSGVYDSWLDANHDGKINIIDIAYVAKAFGTSGDPTVNVTVTNMVPEIPVMSEYIYSAPFIVSANSFPAHPSENGLGPGIYETSILVHNPSAVISVYIRKKIVVAMTENETHQAPIWAGNPAVPFFLQPDQDWRIDSKEISSYIPATTLYVTVKGFVCIISPSPYLDVIAFYTVSEVILHTPQTGPPQFGNTTSIEALTIAPKPYQ